MVMSSHLATRDHAIRVKEWAICDTRVALLYANCVVWHFVPFVLNSNSTQLDSGNTMNGRNGCIGLAEMVNGDESTASKDSSVVYKRWHKVAISIRVMNQSAWLMYIPKSGCLYEFYDPSERKIHSLELPELRGCRVCYTKQGWLLLYRRRNHLVFFFNPFTRETINLPSYELAYEIMAFSCAPTSTNCVVFSIKHVHPTVVVISTCHPTGASEWTIVNHRNRLSFVSSIWDKPVFFSGLFYCLSLTGWLGVYDPVRRYWKVLAMPPPRCPEYFFVKNWWKGKFMTEHNGDLLVVYTSQNKNPIIYKLYRSELAWKEMESLRSVTIFASFLTSLSGANLLGIMRNSVYFSKFRFFGKRCISYSFDDYRYYPRKQQYDWGEQPSFENIWIEPPHHALSSI
ncbi:hypothetical protein GOBAR_AA31820 [Gossypium barbadense]|uniref:KIB1-4 beta-propeller domain-containing protein n=3 Tax=Gossypium TaxID=3633 RepID=A0A2P5WCN6_GOSBA|nr:hypothetical protein GOBAR_AA31820 [Gossypium barbadense]